MCGGVLFWLQENGKYWILQTHHCSAIAIDHNNITANNIWFFVLQWHTGVSCEENARRLAANGADDNIGIPFDSDLIKCCPMCAVPIEKDEGCAQMMCKRCKHVFCWYCLASLDVSKMNIWYANRVPLQSGNFSHLSIAGWFSVTALRQRSVQEQTGSFTSVSGLASGPSNWNIRWLWDSSAGRIAVTTISRSLYCMLPLPHLHHRLETRRCRGGFWRTTAQ